MSTHHHTHTTEHGICGATHEMLDKYDQGPILVCHRDVGHAGRHCDPQTGGAEHHWTGDDRYEYTPLPEPTPEQVAAYEAQRAADVATLTTMYRGLSTQP
jgi:hypothetical protein